MERPSSLPHISDGIMSARGEGAEAFNEGASPSDNPYTKYTDVYFAWLRGWHTTASMQLLNKHG